MLDTLLVNRFHTLLDSKLSERHKQFPMELTTINSQAAAKGAYGSSAWQTQTRQAFEQEFGIRSIITWESLVRVHKTLGCPMSQELRNDFKAEMHMKIDLYYQELSATLKKQLRNIQANVNLMLENAHEQILQKHDIEVDLYVESLTLSESPHEKHPMTQNYNFYGNVGAVQTGANASANVIQNLGDEDRAALSTALIEVRAALEQNPALSDRQKQELLEIADDCATQINSEAPNNTKLLTMFNVLGTAVQSLASAQPAYQTLKMALLPLGITLP